MYMYQILAGLKETIRKLPERMKIFYGKVWKLFVVYLEIFACLQAVKMTIRVAMKLFLFW